MANPAETPRNAAVRLIDMSPIREKRGWFIGLGIAFVVLGVLAIFAPFFASIVTTMFLGWLLILGGIFQGVHAVQNRRWGGAGWAIASSVVEVIAGILLVVFPVTGTVTLTLILAVFFAAEGVIKIVRALQHRSLPAWGWLVFDGILTLALGVLILARWPSTAAWALGLLVGIDLLFSGSSMLMLGLSAGRAAPARV